MRNHRVTLSKIAQYAGTSVNTVSLALRDSQRISVHNRQRIQQLAKELGYVPNYAAQALVSSKSGIIGIYAHSLYDAVRVAFVDHLITELHTQNYKPMLALGKGHDGPWYTSPWMQSFQSLNVDAIIVVAEEYGRVPDWHIDKPAIFVACQPYGDLKCDYLALDRKEAARIGIEHLLACGHENILVACTGDSLDFEGGAAESLEAEGLKFEKFVLACDSDLELLVDRLVHGPNRPSAVLSGDSPIAADLIRRLRSRSIAIPGDVAIAGYDYLPWADQVSVPLTTIEQPIEKLARDSVQTVKRRLDNPAGPFVRKVYKHNLCVRESTCGGGHKREP